MAAGLHLLPSGREGVVWEIKSLGSFVSATL